MRYLLLSSLLLTLICCAPSAQTTSIAPAHKQAITIFTDTTGAYLYKNKINLFGHYLSGLMMIKPMGGQDYKVAIATEFGAKILDFEITNGAFILHDCIPEMRRKLVMKIVERDMKMLLGIQVAPPKAITTEGAAKLYRFQAKRTSTVYTLGEAATVTNISGYKRKHKRVQISLSQFEGHVPTHITLEHFGMPVHIDLSIIKYPGHVAE